MSELSIAIIHEDPAFLVVDKPSGLLSVPGRAPEHKDCLITRVQATYPEALTVHRLDCHTSGLTVIALGKASQRNLSMQFQNRVVDKCYVAKIIGHLETETGSVELPLICDWPNRPLQKVDFEQGKHALTHYKVLAYEGGYTRVLLTPVTGRSHQLRVHMQALGHPIVGDVFYAPADTLAAQNRLCLHASELSFDHPETGQRCAFSCPADF